MHEVELKRRSIGALSSVLPDDQAARFEATAQQAGRQLDGRTIWNVSSTEAGGGVAEMLHNLLGYFLDAGVRSRWLIVNALQQARLGAAAQARVLRHYLDDRQLTQTADLLESLAATTVAA